MRGLKVEPLSDEQLKQAFNRAVVTSFTLALKRLSPEVIKRPNMPAVEYKLSAYRVMVRMATNSAESMRLIEEARRLAEENKQSSAAWDLMELAFRIEQRTSRRRCCSSSSTFNGSTAASRVWLKHWFSCSCKPDWWGPTGN